MRKKIILLCWALVLFSSLAQAQEKVDLSTINERLIRLEEGQKSINQRFEDVNNRFDDVNKRIDDLQVNFNNRFNDVMKLLHIMITVLGLVFVGIFGTLLMMWRKLITLEAKVVTVETKVKGIYTFDESREILVLHDERISKLETKIKNIKE
jgi:hypothetical protein